VTGARGLAAPLATHRGEDLGSEARPRDIAEVLATTCRAEFELGGPSTSSVWSWQPASSRATPRRGPPLLARLVDAVQPGQRPKLSRRRMRGYRDGLGAVADLSSRAGRPCMECFSPPGTRPPQPCRRCRVGVARCEGYSLRAHRPPRRAGAGPGSCGWVSSPVGSRRLLLLPRATTDERRGRPRACELGVGALVASTNSS